MIYHLFLITANCFCFTYVEATCKVPAPVLYPISNLTLSKTSARRDLGVSVGLVKNGFSSQPMALSINADWNNTVLYTTDGKCSNLTTAQCTFNRGGAYNTKSSSSFHQLNASNGGLDAEFRAADNGLNAVIALGEDTLTIGKQDISMRIFTPSSNTVPQSALGLGRNSTFIETLHDAQLIASRTWSLFWGLEGADHASQMDGSLIIGGYDRAKTTGGNMTQAFSSLQDQASCPSSMIVSVADITLTFANGTSTALLSSPSTAFNACIKPDIPLLTLPTDVFTAFSNSIGGTYLAPSESYKLWGMDFAASGVFDGNLTYTFTSGLQITIDNAQLVVPDVQVSTSGTRFIPESSARELLVYADPVTGSDMPLLGQVFMTAAYLHVNNDRQEFTMWQAQPTTEIDIVVVGDTCFASGADPSPTPPTQPAFEARPTLAPVQLAGVAISGAISVAFATLGLYVYLTRRRQRLDRQELLSAKEIPWNNNVGINRFSKAELAGSTAKVPAVLRYELDGDGDRKRNVRETLPQPPKWANAREIGRQCELPSQ